MKFLGHNSQADDLKQSTT